MLTVALSQVLGRGVRLEAGEAVAIALGVADGPGIPRVENVELASDGSVRCAARSGTPTVANLASLLDTLLPTGTRVPAPLRYTIARGLGAVEAPPFADTARFAEALRRFEPSDRARAVRSILDRGARVTAPARSIEPIASPADLAILHPADEYTPPQPRRRPRWPAIAAALLASAAAGFAGTLVVRGAQVRAPDVPAIRQTHAVGSTGVGPSAAPAVEPRAENAPPAKPDDNLSQSPDGTRLAFTRAEPGNPAVRNLWLQRTGADVPRRLTGYRGGQLGRASWFPDSRRIAFFHDDVLTVLDVITGVVRHFTPPVRGADGHAPEISADGTKITFHVRRAGAWMLDLTDGSMRSVLSESRSERARDSGR